MTRLSRASGTQRTGPMTRGLRVLIVTVLALTLVGAGSAAFAAWTAMTSGTGRALSTDLPAGQGVSRTYADSNVTVEWAPQFLNDTSVPVQGHNVRRLAGTTEQSIGAGCAEDLVDTISCVEEDVPEGTWQYQVRPYFEQWRGAWGNVGDPVTVATRAPTELVATAASATTINLTWDNRSDVADNLRVERATDPGGTWTAVTSELAPDVTSYSDTTLTCGLTRFYRVTALSTANGDSVPSNTASATTAACATAPAAPTNLSSPSKTQTSVTLQWTDNATNETGFEIERVGNGATVTLTRNAFDGTGTVTDFESGGLACGTSYQYRVLATNAQGPSAWSDQISVVTDPCDYVLTAPDNVTAGTPFNVMITARTGGTGGPINTAYSGAKPIAWPGEMASPNGTAPVFTTSVTFTNGVGTAATTLYKSGSQTLTATDGTSTGAVIVTVAPGAQRLLSFTNSQANGASVACNGGSVALGGGGWFTSFVSLLDNWGNENPRSQSTTVSLSINPSTGSLSASSLTIAANSASTSGSFQYTRPTGVGGPNGNPVTITAAASGIATSTTCVATVN
jgi:fibronectin type 3 domain-containing protein